MINLLFDKTEKVIAWASAITLIITISTMSSCIQESNRIDATLQNSMIERGYHPLVVKCVMEGYQNSTGQAILCSQAFEKYPGQLEAVKGEIKD